MTAPPAVTLSVLLLVLGALLPASPNPIAAQPAGVPEATRGIDDSPGPGADPSTGAASPALPQDLETSATQAPNPADPQPVPVAQAAFATPVFMAQFVPSGRPGTPVDVAVHSNGILGRMRVQVDYGPWQEMRPGLSAEFTTALAGGPWEYWTWPSSPPMGSLVVFRATSASGEEAYSHPFSWAPNGD